MTSHDVIGVIEGGGVGLRGGGGSWKIQTGQFLANPSQTCVKILYTYFHLIFSEMQSTKMLKE